MQNDQVIFGAMKHLEHSRVSQQRPQSRKIVQGKRIHQVVHPWHRDLDEAHLLLVHVQAVRFGVHSHSWFIAKVSQHRPEARLGIYPNGRRQLLLLFHGTRILPGNCNSGKLDSRSPVACRLR